MTIGVAEFVQMDAASRSLFLEQFVAENIRRRELFDVLDAIHQFENPNQSKLFEDEEDEVRRGPGRPRKG